MKFIKEHRFATLIIILSVFFLSLIGITTKYQKITFVEDGVVVVLNPIQGTIYKLNNNLKNNFEALFNYKQIKLENEQLKETNKELQNYALENEMLKKENDRLREMVNFIDSSSEEYSYVGADIVGISGNSFFDGFIINKGTNNNIKKRMVAITADGLVGQVTSVGTNWAIVQTLANENIAVAGYVERTSLNNGIVRGMRDDDNTLLCNIEIPSLDADIQKDDIVLTSGIGNIYPKGIKIGKVIEVQEDKGQISKYGIIDPYVDINKLEEVFIVLPKETREIKY